MPILTQLLSRKIENEFKVCQAWNSSCIFFNTFPDFKNTWYLKLNWNTFRSVQFKLAQMGNLKLIHACKCANYTLIFFGSYTWITRVIREHCLCTFNSPHCPLAINKRIFKNYFSSIWRQKVSPDLKIIIFTETGKQTKERKRNMREYKPKGKKKEESPDP